MPGSSDDAGMAVGHDRLDSEHQVQVGLLVALRGAVVRRGGGEPPTTDEVTDRTSDGTAAGAADGTGEGTDGEVAAAADAGAILDQLIAYTAVHFMAEQLLMRLHGYPGFDAHQQEHDRLIEEVQELQRRFHGGNATLTLETIDGLEVWLRGHIRGTDHALGAFLSRQASAGTPVAPG